jgi:hypothetical protein
MLIFRKRVQYDNSTDKNLTMLWFRRALDGLSTGVLCWRRYVTSPAHSLYIKKKNPNGFQDT